MNGLSPRASGGNVVLPTLGTWISELQNVREKLFLV